MTNSPDGCSAGSARDVLSSVVNTLADPCDACDFGDDEAAALRETIKDALGGLKELARILDAAQSVGMRAALQAMLEALPTGVVLMWGNKPIDHTKLNYARSQAETALSQPSLAATVETKKDLGICLDCGSNDGDDHSPGCSALVAPRPNSSADSVGLRQAVKVYFDLWDRCGGSTAVAAEAFADARQAMRDALTDTGPQPLSMEDARQLSEIAIRTFCQSLGTGSVTISSDGVERIYHAGISLKALSVAVAMAVSRPESK